MITVGLMIMVKVAIQECIESIFYILLESLGFYVVKVWKNPTTINSIIKV